MRWEPIVGTTTDRELRLADLFEPVFVTCGAELVDLSLKGPSGRQVLRVFIDHPNGANLSLCTEVSRDLSALLDVEDPIPGAYALEVSSPGVERPLRTRAHFERFAGREVAVRRRTAQGRERITGILKGFDEATGILVERDEEVVRIAPETVQQASLVFRFEKNGKR